MNFINIMTMLLKSLITSGPIKGKERKAQKKSSFYVIIVRLCCVFCCVDVFCSVIYTILYFLGINWRETQYC